MKCDLCSTRFQEGDICYTYETPSTGTLEQAQAGEAYYCDDPEWALCATCHQLTKSCEQEVITDVEWAMAVFRAWRSHNWVTILPDTEENQAEATRLNASALDMALKMIAAFSQFHTPGVKYTETI